MTFETRIRMSRVTSGTLWVRLVAAMSSSWVGAEVERSQIPADVRVNRPDLQPAERKSQRA